jgi:UDP-N-acetylglucosamine 2-epimerase (non-hydrolysing)
MKILTIVGTRPELIRLSKIIPLLDSQCNHTLLHTGQNFDARLHDIFFKELSLRRPDIQLSCRNLSLAQQVGEILRGVEEAILRVAPDKVLILGDTNSGLSSLVAARLGVPVYHLEAGNRCYDDRVPEEINRRVIDHTSSVLLPYTYRSAQNLVAEGIPRQRIYVVGNPIAEVITAAAASVRESDVVSRLGLTQNRFILATVHRSENVDVPSRLAEIMATLARIAEKFGLPIVLSVHPRTRLRIASSGVCVDRKWIRLEEPFGFFDFLKLEMEARAIFTDSGTVQEEACILRKPSVILRDVTERPETIECGSTIVAGISERAVDSALSSALSGKSWIPPAEYETANVSTTVVGILLGLPGSAPNAS